MFEVFENSRQLLWGKPRAVRALLVAGSPIIFPLYAIWSYLFMGFSIICLGVLERRQIVGAIKDGLSAKGLRASYSSTWPPEPAE